MSFDHVPVMAKEIIKAVSETPAKGIIVDATLGGGGHSKLMLQARPDDQLIAFDRDLQAIKASKSRLEPFLDRIEIIHARFAEIGEEIRRRKLVGEIAIVLFDLGVSSHHLDSVKRGFTYRHDDAPLDMRMDSSETLTAEIIVNEYPQEQIERILHENSDERFAKKIAAEIVNARPLKNAGDLVGAVRKGIPHRFQRLGHPAKRTFQALRMEVNKELEQLQTALDESVHLLAPGGRILVLSYHSGEDKIAKDTFANYMVAHPKTKDGRLIPIESKAIEPGYKSSVRLVSVPSAKKPSKQEQALNPRSKSARLRVVQAEEFREASGM